LEAIAFPWIMHNEPHRLPPLDRLAAFDAAARHLSFTKAATERFLTQSAISRQIAALEEDLGAALFRRRHRALELTEDGQRLAAAVAAALTGVRDAVSAIRAPRRREVLSLTTTPGLASLWLIPRLQDFVAAHPGIDVRIDATYDPRALASEGFDIAIRYGRLDGHTGTALFEETLQPVCAPVLLAPGAPALKTPADLHRHTLLLLAMKPGSTMPVDWQAWLRAVGADDFEPAASLTFTNYDAAVAAAVAGQGVLLGRQPLVNRLLEQGALVAPFDRSLEAERGYYVLVEPSARHKPAVQALAQWLQGQAQSQAA
jgi:LysR family glycine cleavage system transcriptional activator